MIGIYKITSPSGKVYIGQSWDIAKRWYKHGRYKKLDFLQKSFIKYGKSNHIFKVIHELPSDISQNILDQYECLYIDLYKSSGHILMNLNDGGRSGGKLSAETRKKISDALKGKTGYMLGLKHSEETKKKMSMASIGKKKSESHRINAAKSKIGKKTGPSSKEKILKLSLFNKNKKLSDEHKNKIRNSLLGKKHTVERRLNESISHIKKK